MKEKRKVYKYTSPISKQDASSTGLTLRLNSPPFPSVGCFGLNRGRIWVSKVL